MSLRGTRVIYECVWQDVPGALRARRGRRRLERAARRFTTTGTAFAVKTLLGWYRTGSTFRPRIAWLSTYLGHREPRYTYHYLSAAPDLLAHAARLLNDAQAVTAMTLVAPTLQAFFTDRLTRQLQASPRTIASYRDTLRLLLCFTHEHTGKQPAALDWDDLNEDADLRVPRAPRDRRRQHAAKTRNLRLTAIRSLFKYAALQTSRAREHDRAGAVDPTQTPSATARSRSSPRRRPPR